MGTALARGGTRIVVQPPVLRLVELRGGQYSAIRVRIRFLTKKGMRAEVPNEISAPASGIDIRLSEKVLTLRHRISKPVFGPGLFRRAAQVLRNRRSRATRSYSQFYPPPGMVFRP